MLDALDTFTIFRKVQQQRKDLLISTSHLYIMCILRAMKRHGTVVKLGRWLKQHKHTHSFEDIQIALQQLIDINYVRRGGGRGTGYYITQIGLDALQSFNNEIKAATYAKGPVKVSAKRPTMS
jgi:hypothetical protein